MINRIEDCQSSNIYAYQKTVEVALDGRYEFWSSGDNSEFIRIVAIKTLTACIYDLQFPIRIFVNVIFTNN